VVTRVAHGKVTNFDDKVGSTARMKKIMRDAPKKMSQQ
jgi:hypothetical protein